MNANIAVTGTEVVNVLSTPLFWLVSAVGSVALGVIGNLVTPRVIGFFERRSSSKHRQTFQNQARRLGNILVLFDRPDSLTQTKLDSLHALLMACILMLLSLVIFTVASALEWFVIPVIVRILIIVLGFIVVWLALFVTKEGIKSRDKAQTLERRRKAFDTFAKTGSPSPAEQATFLADWDKKEFGMTYAEAQAAMQGAKTKPGQ
jgi:hypothetical protein